jgi:septal ring factor EnvC (AmiA/AmiB activator)
MSRNLGRQAHRAEQNTFHRKLDSDIADTRSLLNASAETAKDLKTQLKELMEKKKEAGKVPRNTQATSNKFNIPIPKIRGDSLSATTDAAFNTIQVPQPMTIFLKVRQCFCLQYQTTRI